MGIKEENLILGSIGDRVVFENEHVRVWIVSLLPGETQHWHKHELSYLVLPLTEGKNEMRFLDGRVVKTDEKPGMALWREAGAPHELHNVSDWYYQNMLVEIKTTAKPSISKEVLHSAPPLPVGAPSLEEILIASDIMQWRPKSLKGVHEKMLWRDDSTGASVALIRFDKGASIPIPHSHASNQMMFCLSGHYEYTLTGVKLKPGAFYCNPKGNIHGPTLAHEDTVVLEIYDGPHYPQMPEWYTDEQDAR